MKNLDDAPTDEAMISPRLRAVSARRAIVERQLARSLAASFERSSWAGCRRVGSLLGLSFFHVGRKRRELSIANVQMALSLNRAQATRIARRSAQNWGMTTCEFLHIPGASMQEIRDYVLVRDEDLQMLHQATAQGGGVIWMMAHLGNWEIVGARLAPEMSISVIVRPLSNQTVQDGLSDIRRKIGLSLISKHGAARPALKALHKGRVLAILPDRHAGDEGALLPLFGRATRFETAPARLAVMSGAPIIPVWGVRRAPWLHDGRIELRVGEPFTVQAQERSKREEAVLEGTRQVISRLEDAVRAHPDQWSWMLRRWRQGDAG